MTGLADLFKHLHLFSLLCRLSTLHGISLAVRSRSRISIGCCIRRFLSGCTSSSFRQVDFVKGGICRLSTSCLSSDCVHVSLDISRQSNQDFFILTDYRIYFSAAWIDDADIRVICNSIQNSTAIVKGHIRNLMSDRSQFLAFSCLRIDLIELFLIAAGNACRRTISKKLSTVISSCFDFYVALVYGLINHRRCWIYPDPSSMCIGFIIQSQISTKAVYWLDNLDGYGLFKYLPTFFIGSLAGNDCRPFIVCFCQSSCIYTYDIRMIADPFHSAAARIIRNSLCPQLNSSVFDHNGLCCCQFNIL